LGYQADTRFIDGMARAGDKLIVLLDIDKVLDEEGAVAINSGNYGNY
jgi:chemotaxis signal transduction protein